MKKFFKKIPAFIIVSLIVLITVALAVFASNFVYDYNGDNQINIKDTKIFMETLVGLDDETISDLTGDGKVNILDVIEFQKNINIQSLTGWTTGIY